MSRHDTSDLDSSKSWLFHTSADTNLSHVTDDLSSVNQSRQSIGSITEPESRLNANVSLDVSDLSSIVDEEAPLTVVKNLLHTYRSNDSSLAVRLNFENLTTDTSDLTDDEDEEQKLAGKFGPSTSSPLNPKDADNSSEEENLLHKQFGAIRLTPDGMKKPLLRPWNTERRPKTNKERGCVPLSEKTSKIMRVKQPLVKTPSDTNVYDMIEEGEQSDGDSFAFEKFLKKQRKRSPSKSSQPTDSQESIANGAYNLSSFIVSDGHLTSPDSDQSPPSTVRPADQSSSSSKFVFPPPTTNDWRNKLQDLDHRIDPYAMSGESEEEEEIKRKVVKKERVPVRRHRRAKVEDDDELLPPLKCLQSSSSSAGESDEDSDDPRVQDSFIVASSRSNVTDDDSEDDIFKTPREPATKRTRLRGATKTLGTVSFTGDSDEEEDEDDAFIREPFVVKRTKAVPLPPKSRVPPKSVADPYAMRTPKPTARKTRISSHVDQTFLMQLDAAPEELLPNKNTEMYKGARNFKKNRDHLVQRLLATFNKYVFGDLIPMDTPIVWLPRLRRTAGRCVYRRVNGKRVVRIELSVKVCDRACRVRDTFVHELCHAAVWIATGDAKSGHGAKFKHWGYKASQTYPQLPLIARCHSYDIRAKFVYRCVKCKQEIRRHSKSLDTQRKVCGVCRSPFELYRQLADGGEELVEAATTMPSTKLFDDILLAAQATPTRQPNKFAQFVKAHYGTHKKVCPLSGQMRSHKMVMGILSEKFKESKAMEK